MIRLSQLTALDVSSIEITRDLDLSPKLYAYSQTVDSRTNTLLVQEDNSTLQQLSRSGAMAPFFDNALMGTANFYPEQGLGLTNFHQNSELHIKLGKVTLPSIEYKKASLLFSQGFIGDPSIKGHWLRIFIKLLNGTEVNLCSVADFSNDTNVIAKPAKLFESQIFSEALDIEFIDVEFLLHSNVPEVIEIKEFLFGNEMPTDYFIEYSAFTQESIDPFIANGLSFTRLNPAIINQQTMPITFERSEMLVDLKLSNNKFSLISQMIHQKFDIESYLNGLKLEEEQYKIEHTFVVNAYDQTSTLVQEYNQTIYNQINPFDGIQWRPLVDNEADHFTVEVTIKIENMQTGLVFRRSAQILVTDSDCHRFKAQDTVNITTLTSDVVNNIVTREVKRIVHTPETPKIVQIERRLFIQPQTLGALQLYDADFYTTIETNSDLTGIKSLTLKIGDWSTKNDESSINKFMISHSVYATTAAKYLLLDDTGLMISSGTILK
jgi:hypothetical protein